MPLTGLKNLWTLPQEENENDTYREIEEGVIFQGHNLWLLAAAMVIACIGLNAGNSAALIGAMLISPLMGPVIGLAFGISILKRSLMVLSVKNWAVMVGTSLLASSLFFLITPFHYSTAELDSFLRATIFDVLLAFVGGVAGFVGIIRKDGIKVMAGVAVATACIPPLCTAGYGIANLQLSYFVGGFYFFMVNCFFIGLGTWVTSKYLKYSNYFVHERMHPVRIRVISWSMGILLLLPSLWLAYLRFNQVRLDKHAARYVQQISKTFPELVIVKHNAYRKDNMDWVDISLLNDSVEIAGRIKKKANQLDTTIHVVWHFSPNRASPESRAMRGELDRLDSIIQVQDSMIRVLQKNQAAYTVRRKDSTAVE